MQHKSSREFGSRPFIPLMRFDNRLGVEWMTASSAGDVNGEARTDRDQGSARSATCEENTFGDENGGIWGCLLCWGLASPTPARGRSADSLSAIVSSDRCGNRGEVRCVSSIPSLPGLHALIRRNPEVQEDESSSRRVRCCIMRTEADTSHHELTISHT